jgi:DNA/RNA-binding domain of Phe-tRNA-synthetase-like protein
MNKSLHFTISPEVSALGVSGAYFVIEGLRNQPDSQEFNTVRDCALKDLLPTLSPATLETDPILGGFRTLHEKVQVSNRKNVSSPENLIAMLLRNGRLPSINLVVDIYNLISCKSRLALGAHDTAKIQGNVSLRLTTGSELFVPLGSDKPKPVSAGEYCYVDDANEVICRLETRQVEKTKVLLETGACFYIVQGNAATSPSHIKDAFAELVSMTQRFCGGQVTMLHSCW